MPNLHITPLFDLATGWRLASDGLQWIIQRWSGSKWRSIAFIAHRKDGLGRVMRRYGIRPTPEASKTMDSLPETFREWRHLHGRVHGFPRHGED